MNWQRQLGVQSGQGADERSWGLQGHSLRAGQGQGKNSSGRWPEGQTTWWSHLGSDLDWFYIVDWGRDIAFTCSSECPISQYLCCLLSGLLIINNFSNQSCSLYMDSNCYHLIPYYKWNVSKKIICNMQYAWLIKTFLPTNLTLCFCGYDNSAKMCTIFLNCSGLGGGVFCSTL